MNSPLSEKLVQLGFSKNQAAVYESLIELGQCKANAVIKRTGLHRNIVYEALDDLVQRKLAFKTSKGGVAFFQLSDASTIVTDAQKQLQAAEEVSAEINSLRQRSTHETKMYEGMSGLDSYIKHIYRELKNEIDSGKDAEFLILGTDPQSNADLFDEFWQKKNKERAKLGIPSRILFEEQSKEYADKAKQISLLEAKLLPADIKDPTITYIWKDTIAFVLYELEPFVVSIENKQLANSFRHYFETLWNQDVSVTNGLTDALELLNTKMRAMKKGERYRVLGATFGFETKKELLDWFVEYHTERIQRGIKVDFLPSDENYHDVVNTMHKAGDTDMQLSRVRSLSNDFVSPMQICIFPDSITFFYWLPGKDAVAIDIQKKEIRDAMNLYFDALWQQDTKMYRGAEAVQQLMERSLEYSESWFIGGNGGMARVMPEFWEGYNKRRIEKGVVWHDLVDAGTKLPGLSYTEQGVLDAKNQYEFKWLPASVASPSVIFIFGNTVANITWEAQPEPVAFVIENAELCESYKKYFNYLWQQDMSVTHGLEAVQEVFYRKMRQLQKGEEYAVLWGTYGPDTREEMVPWFIKYNTERVERGVVLRGILFEQDRKQMTEEIIQAGDPDFNITPLRYVADEDYGSPMQINIYPDSVVLFYWGSGGNDSVAIEINRGGIRNAMLAYFEGIWATAQS